MEGIYLVMKCYCDDKSVIWGAGKTFFCVRVSTRKRKNVGVARRVVTSVL